MPRKESFDTAEIAVPNSLAIPDGFIQVTEEEARAYWASGRYPEEAAAMLAEHSIAGSYFIPGPTNAPQADPPAVFLNQE